jgi:hypothetical protein
VAYVMEHMPTLHIHFDPTLVKSLQIILVVWGASFVSFDSPLELTTKIENKKNKKIKNWKTLKKI